MAAAMLQASVDEAAKASTDSSRPVNMKVQQQQP